MRYEVRGTRYPTLRRLRRIRLRWHRFNRYWAVYAKCWYCGWVDLRMFFVGDGLHRAVCWGCDADGHGFWDYR